MTASIQTVHDTLQTLLKTPGVRRIQLLARDGLPIAAAGQAGASNEVLSAMGAALVGAVEAALDEAAGGPLRHVWAQAKNARLLAMDAGARFLLLVVTDAEADIEPVLAAARGALDRLRPLLEAGG